MDLEDLQSDLNALKKLYGILQSKGNNTLQAPGSENLDEKSKQLLKKLLDGATEEAIQCHSKVVSEKSSAPLLLESSRQQPTSKQSPELPGISKISKEKEIAEERDECQRHDQNQKAFDAEESSIEQNICKICMTSHVKRQISPREKISSSHCNRKTQMMKKNHIHRPSQARVRIGHHSSKTEHHKKDSETRQNQSIVGLPPPGSTDSPMLCDGLERRSLKLSQGPEKEAEINISEEAAMAIRRIEDHLPPANHATEKEENSTLPGQVLIQHPSPVKELLICSHVNSKSQPLKPSVLPNQQMIVSQKRSRTDKMESAPDDRADESRLNRSTNQMSGPTRGKAKEYQRSRSKIADRMGPHYKARTPEMNEDEADQFGSLVLTGKVRQMPTKSQIVKDAANQNASGTVHEKEVGPDKATQTRELGRSGGLNRNVALIEGKAPFQLVGPTLTRTESQRKKQCNEDQPKGSDPKRNQRVVNEGSNPTVEKIEMKGKISAPSSEKGPTNQVRQRVTEMHPKREKVVHPPQSKTDLMSSTIDRGPSRPDRLLSRTVGCSRHNPDVAEQARTVDPSRQKHLPRILSRSGPIRRLEGEMVGQRDPHQQKRLRRELTRKELPRQTKRSQVQEKGTSTSRTANSTTRSSVSRTSDSSSIPSQPVTVGGKNRREQQLPNRMLTRRAVEANRRSPLRTPSCPTGSSVSRTSYSSPSPSQRVTTRGNNRKKQFPPNRMLTHRAMRAKRGSLRRTTSRMTGSSVSHTSNSSSSPSQRVATRRNSKRGRQPSNRMLTHRVTEAERKSPHLTTTHHAGPMGRTPPLPPRRQKSLREPKKEYALPHHSKVVPPRNVGPTNSSPVEEKPKGRLRRFKNKLALIFHHHHHHHHHHHLGHHEESNGQDDDTDHGGGPHAIIEHHHHQHRSLWRYLREVVHHNSKEDHVKLAAETRVEKIAGTAGKSMVKMAPRKQHEGMVERVLKHLWHSRRKQGGGGKEQRKHKKKKVKLHWWQRFHRRRGGTRLGNRKKNTSFRRPKFRTG